MSYLSPKEQRCYDFMINNKGITTLDANKLLGDTRLSATIFSLKSKGYLISDTWEAHFNRFNEEVKVKRYFLLQAQPTMNKQQELFDWKGN